MNATRIKERDEATRDAVDAGYDARCAYCRRYGQQGQCEGCGAPNEPITFIEITSFNDIRPRFIERPR